MRDDRHQHRVRRDVSVPRHVPSMGWHFHGCNMNLHEWDMKIAPALRAVEEHSSWIAHYAQNCHDRAAKLEYAIGRLKMRPDFDSNARDEMRKAIEKLRLTLALCRSAMEAYDDRPTIIEHVAE